MRPQEGGAWAARPSLPPPLWPRQLEAQHPPQYMKSRRNRSRRVAYEAWPAKSRAGRRSSTAGPRPLCALKQRHGARENALLDAARD